MTLEERQQEWDLQYDSPNSEPVKQRPARPSEEMDELQEKATQPSGSFLKSLKVRSINEDIQSSEVDTNLISDGYHTFGELYEHRITNFVQLCRALNYMNGSEPKEWYHKVWRSKKHSDGELAYGGEWFVLGIDTEPGSQITYHIPISGWQVTSFAEELEQAPEWDGHTSADVLERLANL